MNLRRWSAASLLLAATAWWVGACSLRNREGPDVTCAQLECGRINACGDGIIAQCVDGVNVRFHVCPTGDTCGEDWQTEGQYRCLESDTDCEGCRPERSDGCGSMGVGGSGGNGGSGATGGSGGSGASGGSGGAPAGGSGGIAGSGGSAGAGGSGGN
jgi:hypothetical protein